MARRITVLVLSPDGRTTRKFDLSLARVLLLVLVALCLVAGTLWLGWGVGALTASVG